MFVTTATSRASLRNERSDSSASITAHSPAPQPAFVPAARSSPPITKAGSRPVSISASAAIEAVVVFPCVPLTAIVALHPRQLTEEVAAMQHGRAGLAGRASSGLSSGIAVDTTTSAPSGTFEASCPMTGSMPAARSRSQ